MAQPETPETPKTRDSVAVISGAAFQIKNPQTGKCMTVAGGRSTENNVRLVQFTCDTDPSRRWKLTNGEDNVVLVQFDCDRDRSRTWNLNLAG